MERTLAKESLQKIGERVILKGWVNNYRDHGQVFFIDLRDRSGIVQVVFSKNLINKAKELRNEYVVEIKGKVEKRPKDMVNSDLETGRIEIKAEELKILARSKELPFPLAGGGYQIKENL